MVTLAYSLTGSNGDTIALDGVDYVLNPQMTGFGIPTPEVRIEPSAGDGGVHRHSKRGVRVVDMSVTVLGTDRADVQTKLRRLARLLQDTKGATQIVASFSDPGDPGFVNYSLYLNGHYTGGAETQWGSDAGQTWCRWVLSFSCPNPFWQSSTLETFTIQANGDTGRGLLPKLTMLRVSSSTTLGVVNVDNQGDVNAYPVWEFTGPITSLVATDGTYSFGFASVPAGETYTVDTKAGTVKDSSGANKYSMLSSAPKLFTLPPGPSTVSVRGFGDAGYSVTLSYSPQFEVVH